MRDYLFSSGTIEELHAKGCDAFLICGGAGALSEGSNVGELMIPTSALRDEGTSYHYLPPAREVSSHKEMTAFVCDWLDKERIPYTTGKTWTTDAIFRETKDCIAKHREEGCRTVEMETAAFFAVSEYYHLPLSQILYMGDDVSQEVWDTRGWNKQENVRYHLIRTAIAAMEEYCLA